MTVVRLRKRSLIRFCYSTNISGWLDSRSVRDFLLTKVSLIKKRHQEGCNYHYTRRGINGKQMHMLRGGYPGRKNGMQKL